MVWCFILEYVSWFCVILFGLEWLGFVILLGGIMLFIRWLVIEKLGGWDVYNVIEDVDFGICLVCYGY